jgi:hypothetical protein
MTNVVTPGFSDAAQFVEESTIRNRRTLHCSNTFEALSNELAAVWSECREPNWDGFEAVPVTSDTLRNAYLFLEALPLGFPVPSIGAEPDGELTLEWYRSARRTLSISVSSHGDLHFAALLGPNRIYGTEAFFGDVPDTIVDLVRRLYTA